MFGQNAASTGFGSNNNTSTGGGLFGNNTTSTSTSGSLFGNSASNNTNNTTSTGLFGNKTNTAGSGSLFGNTNNNATNGTASTGTTGTSFGFGHNNQTATPAATNSTPSFSFGGNSTTSSNNTPSLFGSNTQSKPLFGGSGTGTTTSLLGGSNQAQQPQSQYTFGTNNQGSSSLFGNNTQNQGQNQLQPEQSLFKKPSLFSASSSDADAAKFKASLNNQPQQLNQNQNQNSTSLFSNSAGFANNSNSPVALRPQASLALDNGLRRSTTPSWAAEKRYVNSNNINNRHASSFNTADRGHISVRKASLSSSQSPVSSFSTSFSGISKPSHTKKKAIIQEDPPPTRSIYDVDAPTTLPVSHKSDLSSSSLTTRSTTPSTGTQSSTTSRPKAADHSLSVVIFGFPSSVTPAVVAHFSKFGNIAENVDSSNRISIISTPTSKNFRAPPTPIQTGKNWLKITYDNPASASRAIQENGTIIAGQYVVGCIPVTAQNYKEFEIASENSIQSGAQSTADEIEDSIIDKNISSFNEESTLPSSENTTDESKISQANDRSLIGKNSSLPSLAGSKKVELKDGRSIFNKAHKQSRYTGSLFRSPDAKKSVSSVKSSSAANGVSEGDKRLQPAGGQSWVSWTSKKAQELVFGWDDL
jgi:hypothetical protein